MSVEIKPCWDGLRECKNTTLIGILETQRDIFAAQRDDLLEACEYWVYLDTVEPPASIEDRIQARLMVQAAITKVRGR